MMTIASSAQRCRNALETAIQGSTDGTHRHELVSIATRLQLWAGSLGVFTLGRCSLDNRVSADPELQGFISHLLTRLEQKVEEILHPPSPTDDEDRPAMDPESTDSATSESDASSVLTSGDTSNMYPADHAFAKANEILDHLFAVPTMLHHDPEITERHRVLEFSKNANIEVSASQQARVLEYIEDRCPAIPGFLQKRLISASSYRTKRMIYLREKAPESTDHEQTEFEITHGVPVRLHSSATGIAQQQPQSVLEAGDRASQLGEQQPSQALDPPSQEYEDDEDNIPSRWGELDIPDFPRSSLAVEDPVTCPYCSESLSVEMSQKKWKSHIIGDLQPYVCLFEDCPDDNILFDASSDWLSHMKWTHCAFWSCPSRGHQDQIFQTFDQLRRHILDDHEAESLTLARNSRRPHADLLWCQNMSIGWTGLDSPVCPMCTWSTEDGPTVMIDHILKHMESISLLSLSDLGNGEADYQHKRQKTPLLQPDDNFLIVGIDFGTTFTSVAWATQDDLRIQKPVHTVKRWKVWGGEDVNNIKAPSAIAYRHEFEDIKIGWGFNMPPHAEPTRWMKLLLVNQDTLRTSVKGASHVLEEFDKFKKMKKEATEVVADFLKLLWFHTLEVIQHDIGDTIFRSLRIHVVLTTPAIWKGYVHAALAEAAKLAGISKPREAGKTTLQFIPEPEAAALELLGARCEKNLCKSGETYIVCDAGGGSVDVVTYSIESVHPMMLKEAVEGRGEFCGSLFVDSRFSMIHPDGPQPTVSLPISKTQIQLLFRDSFNKIIDLIDTQVDALQRQEARKPTGILLIGGLGSSDELYDTLRHKYAKQQIRVLQPSKDLQSTSVCRGAVRHGASDRSIFSAPPNFTLGEVLSRISRLSIGHHTSVPFDSKVHDPHFKIMDPYYGRETVYEMKWYLRRGERVSTAKPVMERNFWLAVEPNCPSMVHLELSQNYDPTPPALKTPAVKQLCQIKWRLPRPLREYPDWTNPQGKVLKKISFDVQMTPIGSAVTFVVIMGGKKVVSEVVPLEFE